ncbi:putative H6 family homeobox 3 [Operophtera brumata]|uniref:Putative H6 family homeobox 3 n=1 Tax=Operophtera brumata TaxID=104452 RepID=A0A0L7LCS6_OPEBR|nr:putative H6 family homeobox 3 [Operophtera brumata]
MDSPVSSHDDRDIEVNVVSGASSPDITSSPRNDQKSSYYQRNEQKSPFYERNEQKSPFYELKKDKEEKASGSAPYTSFSISSILNRAEPRRDSNVLEAADHLCLVYIGSVTCVSPALTCYWARVVTSFNAVKC